MRNLLSLAVLLFPLALVACGGGDDEPKPSGSQLSDEQYLAAICSGTSKFADALATKTKPEDISEVIKQFSADMKALNPPSDLKSYNEEFTRYLDDAVNDPTSLVTRNPPLPSRDVRDRLARKESNVKECENGTFFSRGTGS